MTRACDRLLSAGASRADVRTDAGSALKASADAVSAARARSVLAGRGRADPGSSREAALITASCISSAPTQASRQHADRDGLALPQPLPHRCATEILRQIIDEPGGGPECAVRRRRLSAPARQQRQRSFLCRRSTVSRRAAQPSRTSARFPPAISRRWGPIVTDSSTRDGERAAGVATSASPARSIGPGKRDRQTRFETTSPNGSRSSARRRSPALGRSPGASSPINAAAAVHQRRHSQPRAGPAMRR